MARLLVLKLITKFLGRIRCLHLLWFPKSLAWYLPFVWSTLRLLLTSLHKIPKWNKRLWKMPFPSGHFSKTVCCGDELSLYALVTRQNTHFCTLCKVWWGDAVLNYSHEMHCISPTHPLHLHCFNTATLCSDEMMWTTANHKTRSHQPIAFTDKWHEEKFTWAQRAAEDNPIGMRGQLSNWEGKNISKGKKEIEYSIMINTQLFFLCSQILHLC